MMGEGLGWQWHQLDHMQTTCTLLQTDNHTNTSTLIFYRPDALPDDAQPRTTEDTRPIALLFKLFSAAQWRVMIQNVLLPHNVHNATASI